MTVGAARLYPIVIVNTPESSGRKWQREPVTVGVPLPRGMTHDPHQIGLADDAGQSLPLQVTPTDRWSDGSLRWVLLDFQVSGPVLSERHLTMRVGEGTHPLTASHVTLEEHRDQIWIDTGAARYLIRAGCSFPFAEVIAGGLPQIEGTPSALRITDRNGKRYTAHIRRIAVEERGPLRATVRVEGTVGPRRPPLLNVVARLHFFANSTAVRIAITLHNPRRAQHRGGHWELGDSGSVYLEDASLHLGLPTCATRVDCTPERETYIADVQTPMELYQDSSGGEHWQHATHVNRHGRVPYSFRGYRLLGASQFEGLRATPAVLLRHEGGSIGIAVEQFWQNCPKAIEAEDRSLIYRLFPHQYADLHELQGGEQKTHRFTLMFGSDTTARDDAWFWGRTPCFVRVTPSWYCESRAVPYLSPVPDGPADGYERLIAAGIEGPDSFEHKREAVDEYGWRHFGDLYADHENAFSGEPEPIVSHYNNQYDAIAGFATQFMRTGDYRWWAMMDDLAHHVVDIDIYHTDRDRAAYNNGLFWHTAHYVDAGISSHRSYPKSPKVGGGGPSNEHNYATGLMLHYFLTGDPTSREAAVGLARWVVAMDDGRKTVFRWLTSAPTGLASQTWATDYHGPGRGAGNSLRALLDGHRLTNDATLLEKADDLILRVIHPSDDVSARNLLDAERRWSYTAFLQALGAYLDYKVERGESDLMYAYARASLLRYGRWMADHEYHYLEKPDILEYPTETWAAQDIRKSDVFYLAARYATGAERQQFYERGTFFFNLAIKTLDSFETRKFSRPVVLLLSNGRLHAYMTMAPDSHAASPTEVTEAFPSAQKFVPQKACAKRRLFGLGCLALGLAALIPWLVRFAN